MFESADRLVAALDAGRVLAIATLVAVEGSAPRTVGTSMAFDGAAVIGSIAGGCVEGAVIEVCERVLADGQSRTVEYGVSDEQAYDTGLTCGGTLRLHVRRVAGSDAAVAQLRAAARGEAAGVASVLGPFGERDSGRMDARYTDRIDAEVRARMARGESGLARIDCAPDPAVEVFIEVTTAPPTLLLIGAMEFSAALARAASVLGYRVTVCDPRALFATPARFPDADVVVAWPTTYLARAAIDERTVICVLSHDERYDVDVLALALGSPAGYVGAMGSRRTLELRLASLRGRGVSETSIGRLHAPIGLDLRASSPAEAAVSILAEILAVRTGASAAPLRTTHGAIHQPAH